MPGRINNKTVKELQDAGAQVVEALPKSAYEQLHITGAISLPLTDLNSESAGQLDASKPVIFYCADHQWDMSARAASRLEQLGFSDVYDYVPGKADWLANGLPVEGERAGGERAGDLARSDAPISSMSEPFDQARKRLEQSNWLICVIVDDEGIVLGMLHEESLPDDDEGASLEDLIENGPKTFRPNGSLEDVSDYFENSDTDVALVTTNLGELIGAIRADDVNGPDQ